LAAVVFLAVVVLAAVVFAGAAFFVVAFFVVAFLAAASLVAVALAAADLVAPAVFFAAAVAFDTRPLATISLNPVPGRKAGTDVFFTFTDSPVRGLRAVRAPRTRFSNTPKPVMATRSPLVTAA
jgi:hypothetical protein